MDVGAAVGDPGVVAQRLLVGERDDDGVPHLSAAGRGDGQLDRLARRTDEQWSGTGDRVHGLSRHRDDRVPGAHRDPGCGERGAGVGVGGLGRQDTVDAPGAVLVAGEVGAEQALPGAGAVAAARGDVGVRGAQLAVHLPQEVDQVVVGGDAVQDGPVAVQDAVPVDAVHVGPPVVVAHDAAGLVEHLPPLGGRFDGLPDPAQVDGDVGVAVLVAGGPPVAGDDLEPAVGPQQHPLAVAADLEVVGVAAEVLDALLGEVVALQLGVRVGVLRVGAGGAEDAGERVAQPQDAVLGGAQPGVAGGLDREGHDAVGEALDVDPGGGGALAVGGLLAVRGLEGTAVALRAEGRGGGRGEGDQVGPGASTKARSKTCSS